MIIIKIILLKFIILSVLGYILECLYGTIIKHKLILNRGILIGPYCPIYGITLLVIEIFNKLNIITILIVSSIFISIIEYITSYILEKIFNIKWWDYTNKKNNLDGRICLENIIFLSIGATYLIKKIMPTINKIITLNSKRLIIEPFLLFVIFILDLTISLKKHFSNKFFSSK